MRGSSAKRRKLQPLLPVEYCRLDRAARMLECEVEDLLHWGATYAIKLHYQATGLKAYTTFNSDQMNYIRTIDGFNQGNEINWKVTDKHTFRFQDFYKNINPAKLAASQQKPGYESELMQFVSLFGLFEVLENCLDELYRQGSVDLIFLILTKPETKEEFLFFAPFTIEPSQLFITKSELDKIYQSITTGSQLIKNKGTTISPAAMQLISNAKAAAERNSAPRAELVLSLLELVLGEDSSLIDNPYKLYEWVNQQLQKAKIIEPEITQQAFADILSKAKSARKTRLKNPS
ncbi:hypothetical protein ACFO3I_11985 [Rheinheimera marina]|uniref:Uncharacterized protein n=1 Tax=Rheinheimera marina TaxID=1774958 RepID=A0ABV9JN99_9GAMM